MGSCSNDSLIMLVAGTTFTHALRYTDENKELIPMPPKARGVFVRADDQSVSVLSFNSDAGQIFINTPTDGKGSIKLGSDVTGVLAVGGERTELLMIIEFYDDGVSPEFVQQFPSAGVVANPNRMPP